MTAREGDEAVLAAFARSREEHLGHVIGLASVLACIPGTETVQANMVRAIIDELMVQFVGAKSDTRAAARSIADRVLALSRQTPSPRRKSRAR